MIKYNQGRKILLLGLLGLLTAGLPRAVANVVGADTQNFNPTTNGLDFVTVQSSETLQPGIVNVGLFLNYAVNSLPNYIDQASQSRTDFRDSLLSSDLNFGLGLRPDWDMGLSFPQVLRQSAKNDVPHGEFSKTGLTEIRLNSKFRFWGDQDGGFATIVSANFNLIRNNPYVGRGGGNTYNLEFAYDWTVGKVAMGANGGYRLRDPGTPIVDNFGQYIEPFDDQYIASFATSYLLTDWDTKLIAEVFGSYPAKQQKLTSDRDASTAEVLVGLKNDFRHNIALHFGGGTEVVHGVSSPDWRLYAGINWEMGPIYAEEPIVRRGRGTKVVEGDPFKHEPQPEETFVGRDVLFEFNSADVKPSFRLTLQRMADYLRRPPVFKRLVIEGHTDSVGGADYNHKLSRERAQMVRRVLVTDLGLPESKVVALGKGESEPIADNGNYQGRALNRRVEFKVLR